MNAHVQIGSFVLTTLLALSGMTAMQEQDSDPIEAPRAGATFTMAAELASTTDRMDGFEERLSFLEAEMGRQKVTLGKLGSVKSTQDCPCGPNCACNGQVVSSQVVAVGQPRIVSVGQPITTGWTAAPIVGSGGSSGAVSYSSQPVYSQPVYGGSSGVSSQPVYSQPVRQVVAAPVRRVGNFLQQRRAAAASACYTDANGNRVCPR